MSTVRTVTYDLLRDLGMTTTFGNPGSTEEPFLAEFPDDFRYILGLHETVGVAMADGFAQASGNAAFVNLHTAPGVGNGMGSLVTAWHNRTPLVVTAGQQTREMMALEPWLINREAVELPKPYAKWSHEPPRADDVPGAIERAYHFAMSPPRGPVFVSIPMDDWAKPAAVRTARRVLSQVQPDERAICEASRALSAATSPVLIYGGGVDRAGAWDEAVQLAELLNCPVWEAPAAERAAFPQDHPLYQGGLPLAIKPLSERLDGHDIVLVAGAQVFRYYPHIPGSFLPAGATLYHLTDDPDEAARAPVGTSIVGDVRVALQRLVALVPRATRSAPPSRPSPRDEAASEPMTAAFAMRALAAALPEEATVVEESASSRGAFYNHIRIKRPASYFATASGGLGFALPGAVGVGLARPGVPIACIVGDGAAMFGIQAIWTAAQHRVPVVYIVLNNGGYGILKAFAAFMRTPGVPGLDLPELDIVAIARGFGATAKRVTSADDLPSAFSEAFQTALAQRKPVLLDVVIDRHVAALFGEPALG